MDATSLLNALLTAATRQEASSAISAFETAHRDRVVWVPVGGKENNRGPIEVSANPGRSLVERLTNGIDAVLEAEYERHRGVPECRSPRQAATAWIGIPDQGLSAMTPAQRQTIAKRIAIKLMPGEDRQSRLIEIRDFGIGLKPEEMPETILSLNASNKIRKHHLAGTYGQGGSSTFAISAYTLLASRRAGNPKAGFTIVKFLDLPPEEFKTGHYVYLTLGDGVLTADMPESQFPPGTVIRHFGYDLSSYALPLGPNSVYGLLNQVLFDPVLPIWLDSEIHGYRRVIKGSRNALNGAVDEGDDNRRGPTLDHNVPTFYVSLGDFGNVGFEYWVLERPSRENKRPSAAFVNPTRPIVLTLNGQNHAELTGNIIRKEAELPYLGQRLIVHIDCDLLTPAAKRALFASSREDVRRGHVLQLIHEEIVCILRSDDELTRLNNEAREHGMRERDESAIQEMRREVARLLRLQGVEIGQATGTRAGGGEETRDQPNRPRPPRPQPQPIPVNEPPTYIRIVWAAGEAIEFFPGQRRYVRIETDANSSYYNPDQPAASRINVIVQSSADVRGATPLRTGRMRTVLEMPEAATVGTRGTLRVELTRPGLPTLADERETLVVETPPARPGRQQLTLPPFETRPVSPDDSRWAELSWPDDVSTVATSAVMENGTLIIYYSTAFPKYAASLARYEQRSSALAVSFTKRYEVWLATHSLLYHRDQEESAARHPDGEEVPNEAAEEREQQERCRMATVAALFAAREIELAAETAGQEESAEG